MTFVTYPSIVIMAAATNEDFYPYDPKWRRQPLGYGRKGFLVSVHCPQNRSNAIFLTVADFCVSEEYWKQDTVPRIPHVSTWRNLYERTSPESKYAVPMNTECLLSSTFINYVKKQNTSGKSQGIPAACGATVIRWIGLMLLKQGRGSTLGRATFSCATLCNITLYQPDYMASQLMTVIFTL